MKTKERIFISGLVSLTFVSYHNFIPQNSLAIDKKSFIIRHFSWLQKAV